MIIYKDLKEEDVFVPYKSSMRLWKFKLQNSKFINLHVPNKDKLIKHLEHYQPKDVWFTNGLFLNAKHLEDSTYKTRLIKKNLVFDLDDVSVKEVRMLLKVLKPFKLTVTYIIKTSKGSYQVSFIDDYKKEIVDYVVKNGIKIDKKIYDTRRVIRAPLTYHHTGHYIYFINSSLNVKNRQESLKSYDSKQFPLKEMRGKENLSNPTSQLFIPTYINNLKEKAILYLKFKTKNLVSVLNHLKKLNKVYHLGYGVIRIKNNNIDVICPRAFEIPRLKKIYRDKKSGIKYFDINEKPKEIKDFVEDDYNKYNYSRPHLKYINKFLIKVPNDLKQIGESNPVLVLGK